MPETATLESPSLQGVLNKIEQQLIVHEPTVLKTDERDVEQARSLALLEASSGTDSQEQISIEVESKEKGVQPAQFAIGTAAHKIILNALAEYINEPEIKSFAEINGKIFDELRKSTVFEAETGEMVPGEYAFQKLYNSLCMAATRVHHEMRQRIPEGYNAFVMNEVPIARSKEQKSLISELKKDIADGRFTNDQIIDFQQQREFVTPDGTTISAYQLMEAIRDHDKYKNISSTPIPGVAWPFEEISYEEARKLISILGMSIDKVGDNLHFTYSNEARLDSWIFYYKENDENSLENLKALAKVKARAHFHGSLLDLLSDNAQNPLIKHVWHALGNGVLKLDMFELKMHLDKQNGQYLKRLKDQAGDVSHEHKKNAAHQLRSTEQLIHLHHPDPRIFPHVWGQVKQNLRVIHEDVYLSVLYPEKECDMKNPPYNFGVARYVYTMPPAVLDVEKLISYQDPAKTIAQRHGYIKNAA